MQVPTDNTCPESQSPTPTAPARRALKTRQTRWAALLARTLADAGINPNQISIFSVVCALLSACCFVESHYHNGLREAVFLILAALTIQGRLLCNLLDGMVAVECDRKTKTGEIYNDLPDRISDTVTLLSAGCAAAPAILGQSLGWTAALLALFTAYVRVLGGSVGVPQTFIGPLAKQHRMAVLTGGCLCAACQAAFHQKATMLSIALVIIVVGSVITATRRVRRIASELESR